MLVWITLPITREENLGFISRQIRELKTAEYEKRVLLVCDNPNIQDRTLRKAFDGLQVEILRSQFEREPSSHNMDERRLRIANAWSLIQEFLEGKNDLLLGIEDDGIFRAGDFLKLLSTFKDKYINTYCRCGFVSGVEAGRWSNYLGAWRLSKKGEIKEGSILKSLPYKPEGIEQVTSAGLYFFVMATEVLSSVKFKSNYFGPDINMGIDLEAQGYYNFIDYSVPIGHFGGVDIIYPKQVITVLEYKYIGQGIWRSV